MKTLELLLRERIIDVPDYPKPGILFRDLTPVYRDAGLLMRMTQFSVDQVRAWNGGVVACIESRGFVLGATVAMTANLPLVMFRKKDKLPRERISERYALEYGEAVMETHTDSFSPGQSVVIIDDLLATGGTAAAAAKLVSRLGAKVVGYLFIVELEALKGRQRLEGGPVVSMLTY